jgi:hypothetical protein
VVQQERRKLRQFWQWMPLGIRQASPAYHSISNCRRRRPPGGGGLNGSSPSSSTPRSRRLRPLYVHLHQHRACYDPIVVRQPDLADRL